MIGRFFYLMSNIKANLQLIKQKIAPYTPNIVAVTKYFDESFIVEYYKEGLRDFGENRVEDAIEKMAKLPQEILENSRFHLIGHLQSRKVKSAVGNFYLIHSVDSLKLAKIISDEASKKGITQKILIQVNNANEEAKFGFSPEELKNCFGEIVNLKNIEVEGLMNIAPLTNDNELLKNLFAKIKHLKDELELEYKVELKQISMGMSNDYMLALHEGATIIRLGRILFK